MTAEYLSRVLKEVQLGTRKCQLMLGEIEKGLPIKVQRELATALVPLSKGDKLPCGACNQWPDHRLQGRQLMQATHS